MYSLLPALVSVLFLSYGIYVLIAKGITRISIIFFVHCITTFVWQGTWAVLFQVRDPVLAGFLIKFGYLFIIFLPTTLYHFLTIISDRQNELKWVYASYDLAVILSILHLTSGLLIDGYYSYFWGLYPKAGILLPLHILQTTFVVCRGLYITLKQEKVAASDQSIRLRICVVSILVYLFAAVDYACNYGIAIYPLGAIFTAISLGLVSLAITKYNLMQSFEVAATVAHEMRTPLSTISMQARVIEQYLPHLFDGYRCAVANGLIEAKINEAVCEQLIKMPQKINFQIDRSNTMIDMMLASARTEHVDTSDFMWQSISNCTTDALDNYPFTPQERAKVTLITDEDFDFYGSKILFNFVIFNLLKNSLYAIKTVNKGSIFITISAGVDTHILKFSDTASGISPIVLKRIFETFYTTKQSAGTGIGLSFCRNTVKSFNGEMRCDSIEGQHTTFMLCFMPRKTEISSKQRTELVTH